MGKRDKLVCVIGAIVLLLIVAWLHCWYNKDRYQFVHFVKDKYQNVDTLVFDKNTGVYYYSAGSKVDQVSGKCVNRKWRIIDEK